jgi:hypothetical protein
VSDRLDFQKFYPVEGDSAVAELLYKGRVWGELRLENIALGERGEARVRDAEVVLTLHPPLVSRWAYVVKKSVASWEFSLDEALPLVEEAREWLLENERGREPWPE